MMLPTIISISTYKFLVTKKKCIMFALCEGNDVANSDTCVCKAGLGV